MWWFVWLDYICNHLGNKAWTLDLEWPGKTGFNDAADLPWMVDGKQAGRARSHSGFTFLQVFQGKLAPKECSPRRYAAPLTLARPPSSRTHGADGPAWRGIGDVQLVRRHRPRLEVVAHARRTLR